MAIRYRDWLADRRLPWVAAVLALLLCLPALTTGFQLDDLFQRVLLLGLGDALGGASDMFGVLDGDPERNQDFLDIGALPWWSAPHVKFHFFRPVTTITHRIDYWLWPDSPALMHLHSLLWLGALTLVAGRFYRRLLQPAWIAGLATLLFALDDAHAYPAAWLANRNALIAAALGIAALVAYDRYRQDQWEAGRWLSAALLGASLAAAEFGTGTCVYLLAYALFVDRAPMSDRLRALVPAGLVTAVWFAVHQLGGYGTAGSGFYLDPFGEPLGYLTAAFFRIPVLIAAQWGVMPADAYTMLPPDEARGFAMMSLLFVAIIGVALVPLLRRSRTARFWAAGMLLSAVPVAAVAPSNRLLFFVGLGAMGLIAELLGGLAESASWVPTAPFARRAFSLLAILLIAAHLLISPLMMPIGTLVPSTMGVPARAAFESLGDAPEMADQDLVIVNTPEFLIFVSGMWSYRVLEGLSMPGRIWTLSGWPAAIELAREDDRTLRMTIEGGGYSGVLGRLFRGAQTPLKPGEIIDLATLDVEILELTEDARPLVVRFRFDRPLEDPGLRWVQWQDGLYVPFTPPAIGDTVRLPASRGPAEMGPAEMATAYRTAKERLRR